VSDQEAAPIRVWRDAVNGPDGSRQARGAKSVRHGQAVNGGYGYLLEQGRAGVLLIEQAS
jgi:hypothetical protein